MKYANGVKATTLTTGTGDVTLAAVSGYVPFPLAFSVGDTIPYAIRNDQNWEWGVGTVQAGGVLERTTVASTLVAGVFTDVAPARITLTGVSEVVCAITAEDYKALNDSLFAHTTDVANPHGVTAAQAGADATGTAATLIAAHESAPDPHGVYQLEAALGTAAFLDAGTAVGDLVQVQAGGALPALDASALLNLPASGVTDHGALTGLADDDHAQYHTDARGDARYAPIADGVTNGDAHDHNGGDGAQIAYASLSGLPTLGSAAAAATGDFEGVGAVSTHNAVATAHGISAWGATLVDDADASAARSTLGLGTAATTASTAYATSTQGANADSHASNTSNPHAVSKTQVGLGSVDNTSDASKPVSAAQQTALNLKANLASPTFTGPVGGITAAMVGAPAGSGTSTGTNTGNETTTTIGAMLNGATSKTTPVDADHIGLMDSAASNIWKKLSWANLKKAISPGGVLTIESPATAVLAGDTVAKVAFYTNDASGITNRNVAEISVIADTDYVGVDIAKTTLAFSTHGLAGAAVKRMSINGDGQATIGTPTSSTGLLNVGSSVSLGGAEGVGNLYGYFSSANAAAGGFSTFKRGSTLGANNAIVNNTELGYHGFYGWTGSDYFRGAFCIANASEDWSPSAGGSQYRILVTKNGTVTPFVAFYIDNSGNLGAGTSTPAAKIHAIATTEQLRCGYDASNYLGATTNSAGVTTFNLVGTAPAAKWTVSDAAANAIYDVATFSKNSTGAGAAGLGVRVLFAAKSSTTVDTLQAGISSEWVDATHATRTSRLKLSTNDYGGAREGIRIESDGAAPRIGFYGATAVVKPTALTATVSAAPAGGAGTADGGWDTSTNRDLAIATINNLKTRVDQLETKLQALGLLT